MNTGAVGPWGGLKGRLLMALCVMLVVAGHTVADGPEELRARIESDFQKFTGSTRITAEITGEMFRAFRPGFEQYATSQDGHTIVGLFEIGSGLVEGKNVEFIRKCFLYDKDLQKLGVDYALFFLWSRYDVKAKRVTGHTTLMLMSDHALKVGDVAINSIAVTNGGFESFQQLGYGITSFQSSIVTDFADAREVALTIGGVRVVIPQAELIQKFEHF